MSTWHVWGDYVHTRPEQVGAARRLSGSDEAAKHTAQLRGFDFERRTRNGFEPWACAYESSIDDDQEFAFASDPVIRGWQKV